MENEESSFFSELTLGGLGRKDVVFGLVCEAGGEVRLCSRLESPAEDDLVEEREHGVKVVCKNSKATRNSPHSVFGRKSTDHGRKKTTKKTLNPSF
jgi:hypothetical protein